MDSVSEALKLDPFIYNQYTLDYKSIHSFTKSVKKENDKNNKLRETIIAAIINQKVPDNYFILASWFKLRLSISNYMKQLRDGPYLDAECKLMAGRKNNYDFLLRLYYEDGTRDYNIELKFNVATVDDTPQFVSPMKPSQYMSKSYEEFYYDNYRAKLSAIAQIEMPSKEDYLKQIHSNQPKCMKLFQDLYYKGCSRSSQYTGEPFDIAFYESANQFSQESIQLFIEQTELNASHLSDYLRSTQNNKTYMLYSDKIFILQRVNADDYVIESVTKTHNCYKCITKSGKKMNVLLRWKNGNGIAFPAFQIS
jgi:hypothetical protein